MRPGRPIIASVGPRSGTGGRGESWMASNTALTNVMLEKLNAVPPLASVKDIQGGPKILHYQMIKKSH